MQAPLRSALRECGNLRASRLLTRVLVGSLLFCVVAAFVTPWTQTVLTQGKVIAFAPDNRPTPIRAPIDGRVLTWFVQEGQSVKKGEKIAEMADNDARLMERLGTARDAVGDKSKALRAAVSIAEEQVKALIDAREASIDMARNKVEVARAKESAQRQKLLASKAKLATAELNLSRQASLNGDGLTSDRDFELAQLKSKTAIAEVDASLAELRGARRETAAAQAGLVEKRQGKQASVEKAKGELEKLKSDLGDARVKVAQADTKMSQQEQMQIVAPRDGTILRVEVRAGTDFVKKGQSMAVFVPETDERAVELWVDGNEGPLVREGRSVRLQFEGWPAVQFVGWPSVAVGTFGGKVAFVDRAAREDGKIRIVVRPDPDDDPWPSGAYLRQGGLAKGWVLLNRVTVAYELWRHLNGFPPVVAKPANEKSK